MDSRFHSLTPTTGRGRIVAMERLLSSNSAIDHFSDIPPQDKLMTQFIQRELNEADEMNLLDEEDMHVFDRKPLQDPLQLVLCNTCRKPVKASQYVGHAERCKAMFSPDENMMEFDGGTGPKRPNRKARKLVQSIHDTVNGRDKAMFECLDDDSTASESANFDEAQAGIVSSSSTELKKALTSMDDSLIVDGSRSGTGSTSVSELPISPSKRAKLVSSQSSLTTEEHDNVCGVITESGPCQAPLSCHLHSHSSKCSVKGQSQSLDPLVEEHNSRESKINQYEQESKEIYHADIPLPLATKIYYPRQNLRLRAVVGHLFRESLTRENAHDLSASRCIPGDSDVQSTITHGALPESETSDLQKEFFNHKKKEALTACSMRNLEHIPSATTETCQTTSARQQPHMKFPSQYHDNRVSVPHLAIDPGTAGTMRNRFLQTQYNFPPAAGSAVGSMQQATGIVPVI
eukprot:TRINITY_DN4058_c0_g1_i2.p1 TRINITY_DN4058_c0_g1~~TRINITY_DN4058_c0_g1_i2.p1  ORF type:complete len:460 (+),score=118.05 TRINITY_DN4058_c0_g1_i2:588-1967(+)